MQRGRGRRGDDAKRRRKARQRPLARGVEQALRLEARAQAQELLVQRAGAHALHRLDEELELAARLVHLEAPAQLDLLAVGGREIQQRRSAAKQRAAQ
ncbi:MAG: hypothetical protein U1F07_16225 [Rubrivivax sp.]